MDRERDLILLCRSRIEQTLNWGASSDWTNSDFELLSEKIYEATQVRLSISTLKRIWGKVKYDNSPTAATLNALALYMGYPSWRDFESEQVKKSAPAAPEETAPRSPERVVKVPRFALPLVLIIAAAIGAISFLVKGSDKRPSVVPTSVAQFKAHPVTDDLPNSVIFDYDVSGFTADSVFIQQNWDPRRRKRVSPTAKQHTSIYYQPGYFQAKLIVNDSIVKEDIVYITTKGWRGIVDDNPVPIYLSDQNIHVNGHLGVASKTLREKLGTPVFNQRYTLLHNVQDFGVEVGDFDFETALRNTSTPEESICRTVWVTLLTTDGAIYVPLATKGCVSELSLLTPLGERSGKEHDLSAFGCDFDQLEQLHVSTHGGVFAIEINGREAFREEVGKQVGKIVGVRIGFEGAGEAGQVRLNGKTID